MKTSRLLCIAALAVLAVVSAAHAQIAFRSSTYASITGGGGTPVAPTLRSSASGVLKTGPTRFYLHETSADVNPTIRGNWRDGGTACCWTVADLSDSLSSKYRLGKLTRYKAGAGGQPMQVHRNLADVNPGHVLVQKLVSEPLPVGQTISGTGTLDWIIGVSESSTNQNAYTKLHVYVLREPDTVVGTLFNNYAESSSSSPAGTEWTSSNVGKGPAGGTAKTLTQVIAQAGDRIVIEQGWIGYSTRADNATEYYGGLSATDATSGGSVTNPLWYQFSQDLFGGRISKPTGTVAGDVMIASIAVTPNTATITPPAGWTLVGSRLDNTTAPASSLAIYQRTADASDASVSSYLWSTSGATDAIGVIRSFSGVDTTADPIDAQGGQATAGTSGQHPTPSVTTSVANTLLVASHALASPRVWSPPTGMSEDFETPMSTVSMEGSTGVQATAGATGAKTATVCGTCVAPGNAHILALRGIASGGGGGNALSISAPAGLAQNDVMIASISFGPSTATINEPPGWTLVRRMDNTNGTSNSLAVYNKLAGASEPAIYTWTLSGGHTGAAGGIQAFSGADPVIQAQDGQNTASGTLHATPSVNTTYSNTMIITAYGVGATSTWTPPSLMNETADAQGGSQALEMNWVLQAAPALNISKTATSSSAGYGNAHILVLRRVFGAFQAFETSTGAGAIGGVIKTKVAGTSISTAIVALNAPKTAVATYYIGTVRIEALDASNSSGVVDQSTGCNSTWTLIPSSVVVIPDLTFTAADNGRKNTSFTVSNSYPHVRLRMSAPASAPDTVACGGDGFAVRPLSFSSVTSNMTNSATTGAPVTSAGGSFTITAVAIAGYNGTPTIDNTKITAHAGAVQNGSVAGSFGAANPATGTATGSTFTYSEVGNFTVGVNGVYDSTFTAVDPPGTECTNDFSNTLVGGSYGCSFGNSVASAAIGRFRPDHFIVTLDTLTNRQALSCASASTYTYEGEQLRVKFKLTARNGLGTPETTKNYTTSSLFAKLDGTGYTNFGFGAVDLADLTAPLAATALTARILPGTSSGTWVAGVGDFTVDLAVSRAASPDGPFESFRLGVLPADTDGVTLRAADLNLDTTVPTDGNDRVLVGSSKIRFGRLALKNANGSQLVQLPVQMEAQYAVTAGAGYVFVTNKDDNCTWIQNTDIQMSGFTANLTACRTAVSGAGQANPVSRGLRMLLLDKPGNAYNGSVLLTANLGSASGTTCIAPAGGSTVPATAASRSYLRGNWAGSASYGDDPKARATFGTFKGAEEVIFVRENF